MDIESTAFYKKANPEQMKFLSNYARYKEFPSETVIFDEGDSPDSLFIVLDGVIAFQKKVDAGEYRTISTAKTGDYFGEIGVITGDPRSLRAETKTWSVVAEVPKEALDRYLDEIPGPVAILLNSIIRHLKQTTHHYVSDLLRKEKMSVVDKIAATIVEDLRNPATLISLGAQLIRADHEEDVRTQKICSKIEEQASRLADTTEDISEFARGQHDFAVTKLNLQTLLTRFQEMNLPFFENDDVKINIDVPDVSIEGDERKLLRVLKNLVGNSIAAFKKQEGEISIEADVRDGGTVLLKISDNAGGIPPEIREHFFEPFVTAGKKGTGLGAAVAKSIIEALRGKIWFETQTGKGTTIFVQLPLSKR